MVFKNLTPHAITLRVADAHGREQDLVLQPAGPAPRVVTRRVSDAPVGDVPVTHVRGNGVTGLPDAQPGVALIVSAMVAQAVRGRDDVFAPDTDQAIRDAGGCIVAVPGLVRYH
jgi:hypothetical protein